jgi:DNA repair photolyase
MIRRVENPPNPYLSEQREWLGEPPRVELEVYEEHARSILSENDSPDVPFRWGVNPYRGCQHACAYCYARPTHEYLGFGAGTDFDSRITVKVNAPELLAAALSRPSWKREMIAFSGVTDCYQPLECLYRLTQRCLEVCRDLRNPVGVVTKAYLVVRDADLLADLNARAGARVWLSIPFADERAARAIEVGAPPPARRFEAIRRLADAGVPVGVLVAPIIPGLNDRDVARVLTRAVECGASAAGYTALRLPGSVKEVFLGRLAAALPERAARVERLIRDMRGGALNDPRFGRRMDGLGVYWRSIEQLFEQTAARLGLRADLCYAPPDEPPMEQSPARRAPAAQAPAVRQLPLFSG